MELTSRERVRLALEHKEADMVPIDFGAMRSTGISAIAYNKLKEYLNIKDGATKLYDVFQQLAEPEESILKRFKADVVQLHRYEPAFGINILKWKEGTLQDGSKCLVPYDFNPVKNEDGSLDVVVDGVPIARMPKDGYYFDVIRHPYKDCTTIEDIDKIPVNEISDVEIEYLKKEAKRLYEETDYAILACFGGNIFEAGQTDWGYETFFIQLALNPDLMHYYFERLTQAYLRDLEKYLGAVGEYIDVIQFGDDLGTQINAQISVDMYREMIKPYHKRIYEYVRNNYPKVKVFLHSCGAISSLIPDLIDAGVEVLNPVQLSASNMDAATLKREYGKHLTFWGGGVSTQTTVTFGTVEDIKKEVEELMGIFAPGGGFVFTQVHNIQANISPEKVVAIYDTANKFRDYKLYQK